MYQRHQKKKSSQKDSQSNKVPAEAIEEKILCLSHEELFHWKEGSMSQMQEQSMYSNPQKEIENNMTQQSESTHHIQQYGKQDWLVV